MDVFAIHNSSLSVFLISLHYAISAKGQGNIIGNRFFTQNTDMSRSLNGNSIAAVNEFYVSAFKKTVLFS